MNDDDKSLQFEEKTLVEGVKEVVEIEGKTLVENNIGTNANEYKEAFTDAKHLENLEKPGLGNQEKIDAQEVKVIQNGEVIEIINEIVSKPAVKYDFPQRDFNDFFKSLGYEVESERTDIATEKIRYFILKKDNEEYFVKVSLNVPNLAKLEKIHKAINQYPDNFVKVLEEAVKDDFYYEIREYCPRGNLRDNISIVKDNIYEFIRQMNESIKILHDNMIVHLDIKPSNIVIKNDKYLITDFEIASIIDKETGLSKDTEKVGTDYFTAPEVRNLVGTRTPKADYWSLGMVIYYILTGEIPFSGDDNMWENFILNNPGYIPVDKLPERFQKLVAGLLTLDYEKRIGYEEVSRWLHGRDFDLPIRFSPSLFEFKNMGYNSLDQLLTAYCDDYDQALEHFINILPQQLKDKNLNEVLEDLNEIMQRTNWDQHDKFAMFMLRNSTNKLPIYCGEILTLETFTSFVGRLLARESEKYGNYIIDNFRKIYDLFNETEYEGDFSIVMSLYEKRPDIFAYDKLIQLNEFLVKIKDSGIVHYKDILNNNVNDLIDFFSKANRGTVLLKLSNVKNYIEQPAIYIITNPSTIEFSTKGDIRNVFLIGEWKMKVSIKNGELKNFDGYFSNLSFNDSKFKFRNSNVVFTNCDLNSKSTTIIAENSKLKFNKSTIQGKAQAMYLKGSRVDLVDSQIISEKDGIFFEESEIKEINVKYQVKSNQKLEYKKFWG